MQTLTHTHTRSHRTSEAKASRQQPAPNTLEHSKLDVARGCGVFFCLAGERTRARPRQTVRRRYNVDADDDDDDDDAREV